MSLKRAVHDLTGQVVRIDRYSFTWGGSADIYKAEYLGRIVAVKVIKRSPDDEGFKRRLLREINVWSLVDHPNILPMLGICFDFDRPDTPGLVSPFYGHGNISNYLKNCLGADRLPLLIQIASALSYLHSLGIIHGDVKPSNILINDIGEASLSDYGLSRILETSGFTTRLSATCRYAAPELEEAISRVTMPTDVWAFAMTTCEIFTGFIPFSHIRNEGSVILCIVSGGRPKRLQHLTINDSIWSMLERCWNSEPYERPLMSSLSQFLESQPTSLAQDRLQLSHDVKLPNTDLPLDQALSNFDDIFSSWNCPLECINADANHVRSIAKDLSEMTQKDQTEVAALLRPTMIYQRLIIYTFGHLMLCSSDTQLLDKFKETLQQWNSWDDITVLLQYQFIRDCLYQLIQKGLHSLEAPHDVGLLKKMLCLDALGIAARLSHFISQRPNELLSRRGDEAQALLDLFQEFLDCYPDISFRRLQVAALIKLSKASGLYPKCLTLTGIEFVEDSPVDGGGYGDVWKGRFGDQVIAMKVLKVFVKSDVTELLKQFSIEAVIWRQLNHPNILPFYGVYHMPHHGLRVCLVSPWMENGNIRRFLKQFPDMDRTRLALDVSQGLAYLHNLKPSIIHGDLKADNILITPSRRACLADFGLSAVRDTQEIFKSSTKMSHTAGTTRWQAPELMGFETGDADTPDTHTCTSRASDIYALGCVFYEIFSGRIPFYEHHTDARVLYALITGGTPSHPSQEMCSSNGLHDDIWNCMENCWSRDPGARPTIDDVVSHFLFVLNGDVDCRPLDKFDTFSPSHALHFKAEHPFSVHSYQEEYNTILQAWKGVRDIEQSSFADFEVSDLVADVTGLP